MKPIIASLLFGLLLIIGCSAEPEAGFISVSVLNQGSEEPVEDVEITITPGEMVKNTGQNGMAVFEVEPGDYFVNADVCCAPGGLLLVYHVPVTTTANDTKAVKLYACLDCS